jgi:hypothetical protein
VYPFWRDHGESVLERVLFLRDHEKRDDLKSIAKTFGGMLERKLPSLKESAAPVAPPAKARPAGAPASGAGAEAGAAAGAGEAPRKTGAGVSEGGAAAPPVVKRPAAVAVKVRFGGLARFCTLAVVVVLSRCPPLKCVYV